MLGQYDAIEVPAEDRCLVLAEEEFVIEVPAEWRTIGVPDDADGQ